MANSAELHSGRRTRLVPYVFEASTPEDVDQIVDRKTGAKAFALAGADDDSDILFVQIRINRHSSAWNAGFVVIGFWIGAAGYTLYRLHTSTLGSLEIPYWFPCSLVAVAGAIWGAALGGLWHRYQFRRWCRVAKRLLGLRGPA